MAVAFCVGAPGAATGQETARYALPAQALDTSLTALAQTSGLEIVFTAETVSGLSAPGLSGVFTPEEALDRLLAGSDLDAVFVDARTVTLAQAAPPTEALDDGPVLLDEIVVTTRRTEERLAEVPGSVVVITGQEIERSNVRDTDDVILRLPNVSFVGGASPVDLNVSIRGVSNLAGFSASGPTNGIFVDGFLLNPTGGRTAINPRLLDLERVETAFGPQGTAFGRGTIGGAINYVTRKPTQDFEASFTGEIGSFPDGDGTVRLNLPLGEATAARIVAFGEASDGFVDLDAVDDPDSVRRDGAGGRLSLRHAPSDRLTLDASISFDRTRFDGVTSATAESFADGDPVSEVDFIDDSTLERLLVTGEAAYEFGFGVVRSKTSFLSTDNDLRLDSDDTAEDSAITLSNFEERSIAQEFRFESSAFELPPGFGTVSVNAGVSFSFNRFDQLSDSVFGDDTLVFFAESAGGLLPSALSFVLGGDPFNPDPALFLVTPGAVPGLLADAGLDIGVTRSDFTQDVANLGVFGDVRWRPVEELEIAAGARFHRDRVRATGEQFSTDTTASLVDLGGLIDPTGAIFGDLLTIIAPIAPFEGEEVFTAVTPSASLRYDWSDDFSTYVSFGTGFRPGGFSFTTAGILSFDEETVRSVEAGFNASLLDGRVAIRGSGFFLDYDDIQILAADPVEATGTVEIFVTNAASARSVGAEFGVALAPVEGLRIDVNSGINFARFTDFEDSPFEDDLGNAIDLSGTRLPNAPR
ncbi:MAG: TonB-dependent receptor [Pseudomonadota bacterium]